MILEKEIENKFKEVISKYSEKGYKIVTSRQTDNFEETDENIGAIAISTAIRVHDNFSVPMFNLPVAITITTRLEDDVDTTIHEEVFEDLLTTLCEYHRFPNSIPEALQKGDTFMLGEVRMTGGNPRNIDKTNAFIVDVISFNIRGSEIFNK